MSRMLFGMATLAAAVFAQPNLAPVIDPRGIVNAFSLTPAPSQVAQGAIVYIDGLNLGPAAGVTAPEGTLPTELGGTQVMINQRPALLFSVNPSRIVAQIPWEVAGGVAQVVVRRNGAASRPARVNILTPLPAVKTREDKGYGEAEGTAGRSVTLRATGLGVTEPRMVNGEPGPADAALRIPADVHVGGVRVEAGIRASTTRVGEYEIAFDVPDGAADGDVISVEATRLANVTTLRSLREPEVSFMPLPGDAPELRGLMASDLRGGFMLANGARSPQGCYPSVLIDLRSKKASNIAECLTTAGPNAPSPGVAQQNGPGLAAFVGPSLNEQPGLPVSSKVMVFHPSQTSGMTVDLPSPASALLGLDAINFGALLAGNPPQVASINSTTGEVQLAQPGVVLPGGGGAGGPGGGGGLGGLNLLNLQINLGDGLNKVLSNPVNMGQGQLAVVVGDDENNPRKAKLALLNMQADVTGSRDFPDGWLPLVMPPQPAAPVGPGLPGLPGGPGGGVNPLAARLRVGTFFDGQTRTLFVASAKADNAGHGFAAFGTDVQLVTAPDRWFMTSCTAMAQIFSIETTRRIVMLGSRTGDREFRRDCSALSFLTLDLDGRQFTAVEVPGSGQIAAQQGSIADMNDFLLAQTPAADTVIAMDGVSLTAYRLDLPQGVVGFAQLQPIPALELAIATGRSRQAGDAGFVVFDLRNIEVRQLLLPDAIAAVQLIGVLPATRKLIARGNRTGGAGSQYLIYDLLSGEVQMPANPPGVAFVGNVPAAAPTPGQPAQQAPVLQRVNPKANTIEAITYGADRRQNGALLIRVP